MAAIDVTISENLSDRSRLLGKQLVKRLSSIRSPPMVTTKVTGKGLLCALHIDESHSSGRITAERLSRLMRKRGVIVISAENRLRTAPPLVISEEDLWKGVAILEESLNELVDLDEI